MLQIYVHYEDKPRAASTKLPTSTFPVANRDLSLPSRSHQNANSIDHCPVLEHWAASRRKLYKLGLVGHGNIFVVKHSVEETAEYCVHRHGSSGIFLLAY